MYLAEQLCLFSNKNYIMRVITLYAIALVMALIGRAVAGLVLKAPRDAVKYANEKNTVVGR